MKKSRVDAKKIGPLKLAALNGLSLSRLPLPDEGKEVPARATNDERVCTRCMDRAVCFLCDSPLDATKMPSSPFNEFSNTSNYHKRVLSIL